MIAHTLRARALRMRAQAGPLAVVAVLVLIAAFAGTAAPRSAQQTLTSALRAQVAGTGPLVRDLSASFDPNEYGGATALATTWSEAPSATAAARQQLPAALRSIAGPARYWSRSDPSRMTEYVGDPTGTLDVGFEADPDLARDVVVVAGSLPRAGESSPDATEQIAISIGTARRFGWHVGHRLRFEQGGPAFPVVVSGIVRPRNADDDYWSLDPMRLTPQLSEDLGGNFHWAMVAFGPSADWPRVGVQLPKVAVWLLVPLASTRETVDRLTVSSLPGVRKALAAALTEQVEGFSQIPPGALTSQLSDVIADYLAAAVPVSAVLAVVATGPLATLVVLLGIALVAVGARRARSDRLIADRGGSPVQVRLAAAVDMAVVAVPAAVAGAALGVLATPDADASAVPSLLAAAVLPPAAAAVLVAGSGPRRRRRRLRLVVECVVVALAALGVVVLLQRGVTGLAPDPVVVGVPLLVALTACVPVARVFPWLVRRAGRVGARGAGIAGLLGSRLVAAGGGGAALVAVVAAVGIACASVCVLGTVRAGIVDAADRQVGADLLVTQQTGLPGTLERRLQALGATTARVDLIGAAIVQTPSAGAVGELVLAADPARIALVQRSLPPRDRTFTGFASGTALAVRTGSSGRTTLQLASGRSITARLVPVAAPAALTSEGYWVLVDEALVPAALRRAATPTAVLAALPPGADADAVVRQVVRLAPSATVRTASAQARSVAGAPLVGGLESAIAVAAALAAAGAAIALALALVAASRSRTRIAATLRAIGLSRGQAASLVVWDAVPIALAGTAGGLVAGVVAAALLLVPVDVAPLVGATVRPPFSPDPALLAAVAGATLAAAAVGTLIALVTARRADTAAVLRFQEGER